MWREDVTRFHKNTAHAELRPGCWDARQRLSDMDADGISVVAATMDPGGMGFAGETMSMTDDPELSFAVVRAWNDWYHEEWVSAAPDRFIPVGYVSYLDPDQAAAEVRRNAERGFKGVAFRDPADLNLLWVGTGHWDPLLRACEETSTVLVHHTEPVPWMKGAPPEIAGSAPYSYPMGQTLYQLEAAQFMNSMLFGGALTRFPALKVLIAESGGSWLPHYLRRAKWTRPEPRTRRDRPGELLVQHARAGRPVRASRAGADEVAVRGRLPAHRVDLAQHGQAIQCRHCGPANRPDRGTGMADRLGAFRLPHPGAVVVGTGQFVGRAR